jgi:hypothetical protein
MAMFDGLKYRVMRKRSETCVVESWQLEWYVEDRRGYATKSETFPYLIPAGAATVMKQYRHLQDQGFDPTIVISFNEKEN